MKTVYPIDHQIIVGVNRGVMNRVCSLEDVRKDGWMDKEAVLKPLERLITLLSNTEYETEALETKKEIESIWDEEEFQFYANYIRD
ncbi:hypothetical protein ABNX05_04935 [Lysinibacillus sp. M3]|uniref:Uncharacterized protein n=1 Tax=Lysinibacillus zambalensis TaxID=3160866 RepID=A0ABV1MN61_9BACI